MRALPAGKRVRKLRPHGDGMGIFRITAQECAADIVQEFEKGTPVIFPGRNYRWMMKVQPLMPRRLFAAQVAQAARKLRQKGARG